MSNPGANDWIDEARTSRAPSRWRRWYFVATCLVVVGAVMIPATVVWQSSRLFGPPRGSPTWQAPGDTTVVLDGPRDFAVWAERRSFVDGSYQALPEGERPATVDFAVKTEAGEAIAVSRTLKAVMGMGLIERRLLGRFSVDRPGPVRLSATTSGGRAVLLSVTPAPDADIAALALMIVIVGFLGFLCIVGGAIALGVTAILHLRSVLRARVGGAARA